MKKLDSEKNAEKIEFELLLSRLKPLHVSWVLEFYNKIVIPNGWKAAGITDDIRNGSSSPAPFDPFSATDSLEQPADDEIIGRQRTYPTKPSSYFESYDEGEWVFEDSMTEDRNIFDIFNNE